MGHRLKELRKKLHMTQMEFGETIGLKQAVIGQMETGSRNITPRTLLLICEKYRVNPQWLQDGGGDMFTSPTQQSLDDCARQNNLSILELDLVQAFMDLTPQERQAILSLFQRLQARQDAREDTVRVFKAAQSSDYLPMGYVEIPRSALEKLKKAPEAEEL